MKAIVKTGLELLRIMMIFGLLGALGWAVIDNIYTLGETAESYSWLGAIAILVFIFILYRNRLQFSGWYQGKNNKKLSQDITGALVLLSVILMITSFLLGYLS